MKNWKYIEGAKTGNKNQDWDVGNIDWNVGNFNGQWYVTKNGQKLVGPFMSMKEAERYLDGHKWELQDKYGNAKTGNYSKEELLKYAKQYGDKELIDHIMSGKMTQAELGARTRWFQYQWDGRDINGKIVDKEKTGNKTGNSKWELPDGSTATVEDDGTIKIKKPRDSSIYITKLWDKERAEKQLAQKGAKKVGNARYTTREDVISHLDTDLYDICKKVPAGSPSFAYVSELQKKGWDISTISKYTKEIGKIIDQYKVGNKEYSTDDFKRIKEEALRIAQTTKDEEKKKRALKIADYMKYAHNQPDWGKIVDRYDQELKQIGNSASDDKFAYVMREFDEGKLKTPDGKVVTDPAQAKAIAYSESKKTENGLARARKAMNSWNSERKIEPVGKYKEFIDNLKNAIELGTAGVLYNSLDEQTVKEWVEKAKKEGYGSHISGVQGKKVILK